MESNKNDRVEVVSSDEETETKKNDKGKEELVKDEKDRDEADEKSFLERLSELVTVLQKVEGYEKHDGLANFLTVIEVAEKQTGKVRENIERGLEELMAEFYVDNHDEIVTGKLGFLIEEPFKKLTFRSGKANIPLGEIYKTCLDSDPAMIDSIDGAFFFVIRLVCPDEDFKIISEICDEFSPNQPNANPDGFIGMIGGLFNKVKDKFEKSGIENLEGENGDINTAAVGNVVQDLLGDKELKDNMANMMSGFGGEDFDINSTLKGLFQMTGGK